MAVWPDIHRLLGRRCTNWQHHVKRAACEADLNELGTTLWISCRRLAGKLRPFPWTTSPHRAAHTAQTNARKDTRLPREVCVDGLLSIVVPRLYINIITSLHGATDLPRPEFAFRGRGRAAAQRRFKVPISRQGRIEFVVVAYHEIADSHLQNGDRSSLSVHSTDHSPVRPMLYSPKLVRPLIRTASFVLCTRCLQYNRLL